MNYFKQISDSYILAVGTGAGGTEITETEYNQILAVIHAKPPRTDTEDYHLREDLTWEAFAVEPLPEPELDDSEALEILLGGGAV